MCVCMCMRTLRTNILLNKQQTHTQTHTHTHTHTHKQTHCFLVVSAHISGLIIKLMISGTSRRHRSGQ